MIDNKHFKMMDSSELLAWTDYLLAMARIKNENVVDQSEYIRFLYTLDAILTAERQQEIREKESKEE